MHLRNLTEEVSGQGQWHQMHCPRCNVPIYPHSLISLGNTPGICERVFTMCWICACLYLPIDLLFAVKAVICPLQKQLDIPESPFYSKCLNRHVTIKVCDMKKWYPATLHSHHCKLPWAKCWIRNPFPFSSSDDLLTPDALMNLPTCLWPFFEMTNNMARITIRNNFQDLLSSNKLFNAFDQTV